MKASVILAHPYSKSFNHGIYRRVQTTLKSAGWDVSAHDLYAENFSPVLTETELGKEPSRDRLVNNYVEELMESRMLVFIHPNWWGQPPAMMKGYIDRVIRPPHAYDMPEEEPGGLPIPKLTGKYAVVFNTSNTEETRENEYFGDPLERIWGRCVFGFCGIDNYSRRMFRIVSDSSDSDRKRWLEETDMEIQRIMKEID